MSARDALERREAGRWSVFQWYDESVLELEELSGWRTSTNGGHYVPTWAREKRQIAWNRYCRSQIQRRQHEKIAERDALSKLALHEMKSNLAARQARKDAMVEALAPERRDEAGTELEQIDQITPLGERGPPVDRESSRNRGHGRPIHLDKSTVPTGMSGGDG